MYALHLEPAVSTMRNSSIEQTNKAVA